MEGYDRHQLINVFLGGTLFQDLRYKGTEVLKHSQDFFPELAVHEETKI